MDGRYLGLLRSSHGRERWRYVDPFELQRWFDAFARPLEAGPPLTRRARFRRWSDSTLGGYRENVVAKQWNVHKSCEQQVSDDLR
jgi:hypothetical protein